MIRSSSLKWPITLGVVLIVLIIALLVFWIIGQSTANQWTLLTIGVVFFALVLIGVILYFVLTIQQVALTRRQANFIDSVTHELKSPIASIKLCLQTLDMREVSHEQQREFHRFMLEDLERLDSLIDHLLEAARLSHDRTEEPPTEEIPVEPLLRSCVDTLLRRYQISPDCITLDIQPCVVLATPHDLEMVLMNLVDNAIKYAGQPPRVEVQVTVQGDNRIVIRISDNGKGIRFELRRKIFQRFVRGGSELERTAKGTGLGLYLVKQFVRKMRGKIQVHGRGPLRGATFEVELPGRAAPPPSGSTDDSTGITPKDSTVSAH